MQAQPTIPNIKPIWFSYKPNNGKFATVSNNAPISKTC